MVILLEKLMLALKAMKDWVERELKKISGNVDATKNSLSTVENNLSTVQSDLNTVEDILTNIKMDKHDPAGTGSFSLNRRSGTTIGINSVAMGVDCTASGYYSHAEGNDTTASGDGSHAEGQWTQASGDGSHAEGSNTTASGDGSHAEGKSTIVNGRAQHVQGEYNIEDVVTSQHDRGKYAHIVGNGTSDARSNAHTLDWNGVGWYQGGLQVGGNAQDDGAKNVLLEGDAVPMPDTAEVGQSLVVKAVDENGKPTEWETADASSGIDEESTTAIDDLIELGFIEPAAGNNNSIFVDKNENIYIY